MIRGPETLEAPDFWSEESPCQSWPSSLSPLTTSTDLGHLCTTLSETLPRTRLPILPSPLLPTRTMSALTSAAHSQILSTTLPDRIRDWTLIPAVPYRYTPPLPPCGSTARLFSGKCLKINSR